jgi:hypothetical protein
VTVGGEAGRAVSDGGAGGFETGGQGGAALCGPSKCAGLSEAACIARPSDEHSDGCIARYGTAWPDDAFSERQYAGCAQGCCGGNGDCPGFEDAEACVVNEQGACWTISSPPAPVGWRLLGTDGCGSFSECAVGGGGSGGAAPAGEGGAAGAGGGSAMVEDGGGCEDLPPQSLPSCQLTNDENPCDACLKTRCCASWQACYGDEPRGACGYGAHQEDSGQLACMRSCYEDANDGVQTLAEILDACAQTCPQPCDVLTDVTQAIVDCALNGADGDAQSGDDDCLAVCFPPVE